MDFGFMQLLEYARSRSDGTESAGAILNKSSGKLQENISEWNSFPSEDGIRGPWQIRPS
jgi:hypothetical protein